MNCAQCKSTNVKLKFTKNSTQGKQYSIYSCRTCGVWFINPLASEKELARLYEGVYFEKRSDRGYDNYAGSLVQRSVVDTFKKNMQDLNFDLWQEKVTDKFALEIGCAAGHCIEYFNQHWKEWHMSGIEISSNMVKAAQEKNLEVECGNFLEKDFGLQKFSLITMWATVEHLRYPEKFVQKIFSLLEEGGRCYLSTCNTGFFARIRSRAWRYLNVPEHLWYFNKTSLAHLATECSLKVETSFSYGSGFTTQGDASLFYRLSKKVADKLARYFHLGDMIVISLVK